MSDPLQTPVILKADSNQSLGFVQIKHFDSQERITRALKAFVACWAAAFLSIFIPLAHFILVPAFFLAGLIFPYFIYKKESFIIGGQGSCPKCKADLVIEKGNNEWPLKDLCTGCKSNILITKT